ncbi:tRNA adenosine(34) deaminase TadA [Rarobacter incanus]|nr:tRNA adenosine(34) deaminase TadA [Rarobacter incanus]
MTPLDLAADAARQSAWMREAMALADRAQTAGDVPVGALVVGSDGEILGRGWNDREARCDPTGHAEVMALRQAATAVGRWRLADATLVVTLEPCAMCAGAALGARIRRIVLGAWDEKAGACGSVWDIVRDRRMNHWIEVVPGVLADECSAQLSAFFLERRGDPRQQ